MKAANYAPVYCALYPQLAEMARKHGYAMAVHGTLGRDFDLICIPWVDAPSEPQELVNEITKTFAIKQLHEPDTVCHGRQRYTLSVAFGECSLDLQFVPKSGSNPLAGPLADALLKLYMNVKRLNTNPPEGWTPFLLDEVAAVENLLRPDNIIQANRVGRFQPTLFQCRTRPANPKRRLSANDGWSQWEECSESSYNYMQQFKVRNDIEYDVRTLCEEVLLTSNDVVSGADRTTSGAIGQP